MKSTEAAHLAFAIAGVLGIVYGILLLTGIISFFEYPRDSLRETILAVLTYLFPAAVLLAAGIYLLRNAKLIAARYFAGRGDDGSPPLEVHELQALSFSCCGLLIFLAAIPDLANLGYGVIWLRWDLPESEAHIPSQMAIYAGTLVQALAGAYLFFYGRRFARFWRRISKVPPDPPPVETIPCPTCSHPFSPDAYRTDAVDRRCSKCKQPLPDDLFGESD